MDLIDWNALFSNFLWILALGWLLAIVSMARWEAYQKGTKTGKQLSPAGISDPIKPGRAAFLFGVGSGSR